MKFIGKYMLILAAVLFSPLLLLALPFVLLARFSGKENKALIGLVISDRWPAAIHYLVMPYEIALWWAGARTVVLRPGMDAAKLKAAMSSLNGLLFSGGEDIDHKFFEGEGDCAWPNLMRDEFEFALLRQADELGLPVLGICRGEQLLAVHYGGKLESHRHKIHLFRQHAAKSYWIPSHQVYIKPETKLCDILGKYSIMVNSLHCYNISDPGKMHISAKSNDRLVEAVELPGDRFVIGVQWHPELTVFADQRTRRLFKHFVEAAEAKR